MNKKVVVVLVLLLIAYFLFKPKNAMGAGLIQGNPDQNQKPIYEDENFIFWDAQTYEIKPGDWLSKIALTFIDTTDLTEESKRQIVLDFTKSLALFNGFNWGLYDDVASEDKQDPDSLYIGQIISVPQSWASKKMYDTIK